MELETDLIVVIFTSIYIIVNTIVGLKIIQELICGLDQLLKLEIYFISYQQI